MLVVEALVGLVEVVHLEDMHVSLEEDKPGDAAEHVIDVGEGGRELVEHGADEEAIEGVEEELEVVDGRVTVGDEHVAAEESLELAPATRLKDRGRIVFDVLCGPDGSAQPVVHLLRCRRLVEVSIKIHERGPALHKGGVGEGKVVIRGRLAVRWRKAKLGEVRAGLGQGAKEDHAGATQQEHVVEHAQHWQTRLLDADDNTEGTVAAAGQLAQVRHEVECCGRVEATCWLINENHGRVCHQLDADAGAALLPAREPALEHRANGIVRNVGELEVVDESLDRLGALCAGHVAAQLHGQLQGLAQGQHTHKLVVLKGHAAVRRVQHPAIQHHIARAVCMLHAPRQRLHQQCLARRAGSNDARHPSLDHKATHIVQQGALGFSIHNGQITKAQHEGPISKGIRRLQRTRGWSLSSEPAACTFFQSPAKCHEQSSEA
eukprot:m.188460 g.188460  ORF g.188460 m.188460 type:complete len:434 (+) comp15422_c2_seq7:2742-4043(+)